MVNESQHLEARSVWSDVAIDFVGPIEYLERKWCILVVIDKFSNWIAPQDVRSFIKNVVKRLRELFQVVGAT